MCLAGCHQIALLSSVTMVVVVVLSCHVSIHVSWSVHRWPVSGVLRLPFPSVCFGTLIKASQ